MDSRIDLDAAGGPLPSGPKNGREVSALICFSHLRWDFVHQRPQHLMTRFAKQRPVFFFEEHIPCDHPLPYLEMHPFPEAGVVALRPRLPHWWDEEARTAALRRLLDTFLQIQRAERPVLWFYTPMMFGFARHVEADAIVYDCMDELGNFLFAPPALRELERELMRRADVVFTGGVSLYEAKRALHDNIHAFPSSVDVDHFASARGGAGAEPADQAGIGCPRLGYCGVIDERMDIDLLREVAAARPGWHFVLLGPVVKIDPATLPRAANLHYLGGKSYQELPRYMAGWQAALLPFAGNEATRFLSPTKVPEYLAAGLAVVSTPIADVVRNYSGLAGVRVAADPKAFVAACEAAIRQSSAEWQPAVDSLLDTMSWDRTFQGMAGLLEQATQQRRPVAQAGLRAVRSMRNDIARTRRPDVLIVGAGFAGAVLAERLAAGSGLRVWVIDRRGHVGGNAFDEINDSGLLVHRYGPHIFHTNSADVFQYLSRFTAWRPYEHRVLASIGDKLVPMPINRTTLNQLFGLSLVNDAQASDWLAQRAEKRPVHTSRDAVVSQVGSDLYRLFFESYTRKQWGLDPSELDSSVAARVAARTSDDDRYFLDTHQAMPRDGYTRLFENMLDHDNITVMTGVEYKDAMRDVDPSHTVFTGPIDEYFGHRFGKLPYRSLEFRHVTLDQRRFQPVAVVNYPSADVAHTRITEFKHLTGQVHPCTSLAYEYGRAEGDPYYPIPNAANQALYSRYADLAAATPDVSFVGRLATYRYYNMDQVVGQALSTYRRLVKRGAFARAGAEDAAVA